MVQLITLHTSNLSVINNTTASITNTAIKVYYPSYICVKAPYGIASPLFEPSVASP